MSSLYERFLLLFLTIYLLVPANPAVISSTSSSVYVGDSNCNFTFTLGGINSATDITFTFEKWSYLTQSPFTGSTKCYLLTAQVDLKFIPVNIIKCSLFTTGTNQTLSFTLSGMNNPSSTKPLYVNISVGNGSGSVGYTNIPINATLMRNFLVAPTNYSRVVGVKSTSISMDISMSNYIDPTTTLSISYNSSLINLTFPSVNYNVVSSNGLVLISNWATLDAVSSKGYITLSSISITNPPAAISFLVNGYFYFKSNNITYDIQTISFSITLTPVSFNSFSISTPLYYGVWLPLSISSSCNYSQIGSGNVSNPAYSIVTYNQTEIQATSISDCSILTNSSCKHTKNGTFSLSNFSVGVGNFSSTTVTLTSFTYYQGNYYALCKSSISVSISSQLINPYILSSQCDTNYSSMLNSINLYSSVQSVAVGDQIYITGISGIIKNTVSWAKSTINGTSWYIYTVTSSDLLLNGTANFNAIKLTLTYNNQNQTSASNLTSFNIYRNNFKYAAMGNSSMALCSIDSGLPISSYNLITSSNLTYSPINLNLGVTMQIYDYAQNDSITIQFKSNSIEKQYLLAGSLIGLSPIISVNGVICKYNILSDYLVSIVINKNITLPSSTASSLSVIMQNLVNPAVTGSYWLSFTTYDYQTGGVKQILTTSANTIVSQSLVSSFSDIYLLSNNTVTLNVVNSNRNILTKNSSVPMTTLSLTLPSSFQCFLLVNNTLKISWNVGLLTSSTYAVGNTTALQINIGTCYVSFFTGNQTFTILETYSNVTSTVSSVTTFNKCGDLCYQCSTTCTTCFNQTYTTFNLYYNNHCYNVCPTATYLSSNQCLNCYPSCATCNGSTYQNCTSCSNGFSLDISGVCESLCGSSKYLSNGICLNCHPNCQSCVSYSSCFICKQNATMIGSICQFTSCFSPCSTCQGSQSTCMTCISSKSLYQTTCVDSCPTGTYKSTKGDISTCQVFDEPSTYMPVTITGIVCMLVLLALREYSNKKIGNDTRRRMQAVGKEINYKINILRVGSVLYGYLELITALVIILKNSSYGFGSQATVILAIGLIVHFLSNMAFTVGLIRLGTKKKVVNQSPMDNEGSYQGQTSVRYRVVTALSIIFTFKTYKLLFANIFIDRSSQEPYRQADTRKQFQTSENPLAGVRATPTQSQNIQGSISKEIKASDQNLASRKPIRSNSFNDQNPIIKSTISIVLPQNEEKTKLVHPFMTYLTLANILAGSLLILVGSSIQILKAEVINMLLWGIDCLAVVICSLGLTAWDLWVFTNLLHSEQHSEMSNREEANNTHENLKQEAEVDIKIEPKAKSPKKTSKAKLSQRTIQKQFQMEGVRGSIKRECDEETVAKPEHLPALKIFDDFDEKDEDQKQTKTKKFSSKNLKRQKRINSKRNVSVNHSRNPVGYVCDDLYINFAPDQKRSRKNRDLTSFFQSHHSGSPNPNHSLQEDTLGVDGEFEDQPPNFADISDIQQGRVQPINLSIGQDLAGKLVPSHTQKQQRQDK